MITKKATTAVLFIIFHENYTILEIKPHTSKKIF